MHRELREGEADAGLVELVVDGALHVVVHAPIVGVLHPHADADIDAAGIERIQGDEGRGRVEDALVGRDDAACRLLHPGIVFAIFHADHPVYAAGFLVAVIHHHAARRRAVGDVDRLVVGRGQDGVEDLYLPHRAALALALYPVAHLVGAEQQDDEPAGEVLQVAAQGHAHGHTGRGQQGGEGGGLDAQLVHDGHDEQNHQQDVHQALHEAADAGIDLAPLQDAPHQFVEEGDEETPDDEDDQRPQDAPADVDAAVYEVLYDLLHFVGPVLRGLGGCSRRQ